MKQPAIGDIIDLHDYAFVVTAHDPESDQYAIKVFPTADIASNFVHDMHAEQNPEWHKKQCSICERLRKLRGE